MFCLSVLVVTAVTGLCLGTGFPPSQSEEPLCPQHSCTSGGPQPGCSCDATCVIYGDCCRDSLYYNQAQQTRNMDEYECVRDPVEGLLEHTVYMRAKCSQNYEGTAVKELCLKGNTLPDTAEGMPVTSVATNITYANVYCAFCNHQELKSLRPWYAYVKCDRMPLASPFKDNTVHAGDNQDIGAEFNMDYNLVYNEGSWGVIVPGSNLSFATPCQADFTVSQYANHLTVLCLPSVNTCTALRSTLEHERTLCRSYTAAVYQDGLIFRNKHCASCNGYTHYTCVPPPPPLPPAKPSYPIVMILNFIDYLKGQMFDCGYGAMFDSISNKCVKVLCSKPTEKFLYGRCVSVKDNAIISTADHKPLCPFSHSCLVPNLRDRGCSCDATCKTYGDCCRDSPYYNQDEQLKNMNEYECVEYSSTATLRQYVYMRGKCSEQWNNSTVEKLCLQGNQIAEPSKSLPVTSTTTTRTYVNHYCALCNGEDPATLRTWYGEVKCYFLPENISEEDYVFMFHERTWGAFVPSLGLSSFKQCSLEFTMPEDIKNLTTQCLPMVKTCGNSGANERDQFLCQSYTAAVYIVQFSNLRFRNEYCVYCNGYEFHLCQKDAIDRPTVPSISIILDTGGSSGIGQCGAEEVWDKQSGKCRKLICPKPSEKPSYGKCVRVEGIADPSTKDQELECPIQHSCSFPNILDDKGCSCDAVCRTYGDCCRDSPYYSHTEQLKNMNEYICVEYVSEFGEPEYAYMRGKCLEGWQDRQTKEMCSKGNTQPHHTKLFPVTSNITGRTYVNHYCALCNEENPASLRTWLAMIKCPELSTVRGENYGVVFHEGRWGAILPGLGLPSFIPCSLQFEIPGDINDRNDAPQKCLPSVEKCSAPRSGEQERALCQSYAAAVYHDGLIFRNKHCASCNGYEKYICVKSYYPHYKRPPPEEIVEPPQPFQMSLDFTDRDSRTYIGLCSSDEAVDITHNKCRKIFCSRPGEKFAYNSCVGA